MPDQLVNAWHARLFEVAGQVSGPDGAETSGVREFAGRVAVITGAANGIGLALSQKCLSEGMRVVMADINAQDLEAARARLGPGEVLTTTVDVSRREQVEALAAGTLDAFGAVHLLFNNAGVGAGTTIWESSWNDWEWVVGVNLWGVIHGIKIFTPIMLEQNSEGHIVNTASVVGLLGYHSRAAYHATKHAVVALSEHLSASLAERGARIKTSVLCPGAVNTRILESHRNRPPELVDDGEEGVTAEQLARFVNAQRVISSGMDPREVAEHTFEAIREEELYILTHPEMNDLIHTHRRRIVER